MSAASVEDIAQFVTLRLDGQLFGLPIRQVRDVFVLQGLTPVPLGGPALRGLANLRGRIVTVYGLAALLGLAGAGEAGTRLAIGVDWRDEAIGLGVDSIGDVLELPLAEAEPAPSHLATSWSRFATRLHKLERELMIELDIPTLLDAPHGVTD